MSLAEKSLKILFEKRQEKLAGFDFGLGRFGKGFGQASGDILERMQPLSKRYGSPILSGLLHGVKHPLQSLGTVFGGGSSPWAKGIRQDLAEAQHLANRVSRYNPEKVMETAAELENIQNRIRTHRGSAQVGAGLLGGGLLAGTGALAYGVNPPKDQESIYV